MKPIYIFLYLCDPWKFLNAKVKSEHVYIHLLIQSIPHTYHLQYKECQIPSIYDTWYTLLLECYLYSSNSWWILPWILQTDPFGNVKIHLNVPLIVTDRLHPFILSITKDYNSMEISSYLLLIVQWEIIGVLMCVSALIDDYNFIARCSNMCLFCIHEEGTCVFSSFMTLFLIWSLRYSHLIFLIYSKIVACIFFIHYAAFKILFPMA